MTFFSGFSLKAKLTLTLGTVLFIAFVSVGVLRYRAVSYRSTRGFHASLLADGRFFASQLVVTGIGLDFDSTMLKPSEAATLDVFKSLFVVTDAEGRVVHSALYSPQIQALLAEGALKSVLANQSGTVVINTGDGEAYAFASYPLPPNSPGARMFVHVGRSMSTLNDVLLEYRTVYLTSIPLMVVLSAALSWYMGGRALRPFEQLARITEQINYKSLNTQISVKHSEKEVQSLVDAFNTMVARLNLSFQQLRQFNADAAHELRTPLAILQGENELALRVPNIPEEVRGVLTSNLEELDRLKRVVNDLLTLAEADAGKQVLLKKVINLTQELEDLIDQMRLIASERCITLLPGALPLAFVQADELWIRRALLNIFDNAIKYSRDHGRVEIWAQIEGSRIRIFVRDHGIGISKADLPRVFDRLFRTDPARARKSGGAGLGLSLVKWIIEAHDGTVVLDSQIDRGTTVVIELPLAAKSSNG